MKTYEVNGELHASALLSTGHVARIGEMRNA